MADRTNGTGAHAPDGETLKEKAGTEGAAPRQGG